MPTTTRKRRPFWPLFIVALLSAHVAGMAVAVTIARHDRSFLVVPDYYGKAQHWDQVRAEKQASEKLGWKVVIEAAPSVDARGGRAVRFTLTDSAGNPLDHPTLGIEYFHHAHPGQSNHLELTADADDPRHFTAVVPMQYGGIWEFHLAARAGDKLYTNTLQQYVVSN